MEQDRKIAYFSMEIGIDPALPTYSGGLGVLAGDTIHSAADLKVPMVAVTLIDRKGYFKQNLGPDGWQTEEPVQWNVGDKLKETKARVAVVIEGRIVHLRAWQYDVTGISGYTVPVYFLDADLEENSAWDRELTHCLYNGDSHYRLCQEVILGVGGVRLLRALGYSTIEKFHMNEGHAALLTLEIVEEEMKKAGKTSVDGALIDTVKKKCVFTTHTPVSAGLDKFPMDMAGRVLGPQKVFEKKELLGDQGFLNMASLALNLSGYVNAVSKKHAEVSRRMFPQFKIDSITNGVRAASWTSKPFQDLFDRHLPGWREDNTALRQARKIPTEEIWTAHSQAKQQLMETIQRTGYQGMDAQCLTLGFARRAASYKRADLIFYDLERLKKISAHAGALQIVFAGKAHPQDLEGKELIKKIVSAQHTLAKEIRIVYLENYGIELGRILTSGVDIWLNTPQPPMEASGTSGMKAALNGVPSLSTLDGWWIEGCTEGVTGWAIGSTSPESVANDSFKDADALYKKMEETVIPLFYKNRDGFIDVMKHAIAQNGSFFNTQRMIQEYSKKAYFS